MSRCPHCGKEKNLKAADPAEYKRRKIANAKASLAKAKARGTKMGRPKIRDDEHILELRRLGHSIRAIAIACGVSSSAVQRALK